MEEIYYINDDCINLILVNSSQTMALFLSSIAQKYSKTMCCLKSLILNKCKNIKILNKFNSLEFLEINELSKLKENDLAKFTNLKGLLFQNVTMRDINFNIFSNLYHLEVSNSTEYSCCSRKNDDVFHIENLKKLTRLDIGAYTTPLSNHVNLKSLYLKVRKNIPDEIFDCLNLENIELHFNGKSKTSNLTFDHSKLTSLILNNVDRELSDVILNGSAISELVNLKLINFDVKNYEDILNNCTKLTDLMLWGKKQYGGGCGNWRTNNDSSSSCSTSSSSCSSTNSSDSEDDSDVCHRVTKYKSRNHDRNFHLDTQHRDESRDQQLMENILSLVNTTQSDDVVNTTILNNQNNLTLVSELSHCSDAIMIKSQVYDTIEHENKFDISSCSSESSSDDEDCCGTKKLCSESDEDFCTDILDQNKNRNNVNLSDPVQHENSNNTNLNSSYETCCTAGTLHCTRSCKPVHYPDHEKLSRANNIYDCSKLTRLRSLAMGNIHRKDQVIVKNLPHLNRLKLARIYNIDIDNIDNLTRLKITNSFTNNNIYLMNKLTNVNCLNIGGMKNIESFSIASNITKLSTRKYSNKLNLNNYINLKELSLHSGLSFPVINSLSHLTKLRLDISNMREDMTQDNFKNILEYTLMTKNNSCCGW